MKVAQIEIALKIAKKDKDVILDELVAMKREKPKPSLLDGEEAADFECRECHKTAAEGVEFHTTELCVPCLEKIDKKNRQAYEVLERTKGQELELKALKKKLKLAEKQDRFEEAGKISAEIERLKRIMGEKDKNDPKLPGMEPGPPVSG